MLVAKGANVLSCVDGGHTALQYAASRNRPEILELLLQNHADPNVKDDHGATALHRAASRGNLKCVQLLLQHNKTVDVDSQDSVGNTAL